MAGDGPQMYGLLDECECNPHFVPPNTQTLLVDEQAVFIVTEDGYFIEIA